MATTDTSFTGSVPGLYDRYLGPLLFQPCAREAARRVASLNPSAILETAAGTGILTEAVHRALPTARIVATDLNPAMLEVARQRIASPGVEFRQADAMQLPFAEASFDLVMCQFGVMFFPDRVHANAEARRVLRDGGHYLLLVWDRLERNPASQIAHDRVAALFPDDPPRFLARTPFGYADPAAVTRDLRAAGFSDVQSETVELESLPIGAREAAIGLVGGSPLRSEVEARAGNGLDRAIDAVTEGLRALEVGGRLQSALSSHIVMARR